MSEIEVSKIKWVRLGQDSEFGSGSTLDAVVKGNKSGWGFQLSADKMPEPKWGTGVYRVGDDGKLTLVSHNFDTSD